MLFTDEHRTPLDAAEGARLLVELAERGPTGLLHVGGPERLSRAELGERVLARARARGLDLPEPRRGIRADLGLAETRVADASLDCSRLLALCAALGVAPPRPV